MYVPSTLLWPYPAFYSSNTSSWLRRHPLEYVCRLLLVNQTTTMLRAVSVSRQMVPYHLTITKSFGSSHLQLSTMTPLSRDSQLSTPESPYTLSLPRACADMCLHVVTGLRVSCDQSWRPQCYECLTTTQSLVVWMPVIFDHDNSCLCKLWYAAYDDYILLGVLSCTAKPCVHLDWT